MSYLLGIDGGGTKTQALIADLDGNIIGEGFSGSSNYHVAGLETAVSAISDAIEKAIVYSQADIHKFDAVCLGLAGAGRESDRNILLSSISGLGLSDKIIITHDAAIALAGATICQAGVVVISGTGAMAFGINSSGQQQRSSGWGNILGDEGSAYYIGRRALSAACRSYDGRGDRTSLVETVIMYLGIGDFSEIVKAIYSSEAKQLIANIAPLVVSLAESGDNTAIEITKDAGYELALAANAVIRGLSMENDEFSVATSGSVFNAGELLLEPFRKNILFCAPKASIISPRFGPSIGALLVALRESGINLSETILGNIKATEI